MMFFFPHGLSCIYQFSLTQTHNRNKQQTEVYKLLFFWTTEAEVPLTPAENLILANLQWLKLSLPGVAVGVTDFLTR